MASKLTQPVGNEEFWPWFNNWATARLNAGLPWVDTGWTEWASIDFSAYLLHRVLEDRDSARSRNLAGIRLACDVELGVPALEGASGPLSLVINGRHRNHSTYLIEIEAQSFHDHPEQFLGRLSQKQSMLERASRKPGYEDAIAAVIAITIDTGTARKLVLHRGYVHRMEVRVHGFASGEPMTAFDVVSLGVDAPRPNEGGI